MTATLAQAKRFVLHVENTLGCLPHSRARAAAKLLREVQADPVLYTWDNLNLAVEYLRRQRKSVGTPSAVLLYVQTAVDRSNQPEVLKPITELVAAAIEHEQYSRTGDWERWVGRLVRAQGDARHEVYADWLAARQVAA